MLLEVALATWHVIVLSAPWLLFGFFAAGVLHELLPTSLVQRNLEKPGLASVLKAGAIGLPLPLCSCSVIPLGVSLRRSGASKGATAGFFVSTPEIGVDSFLLSYVLLGPFVAMARVCLAFASALLVGLGIDYSCRESPPPQESPSSCCKSKEAPKSSLLRRIVRYAFVDIVDDLSKLLVIGFFLAGLAGVLLSEQTFLRLADWGVPIQLLMLVVSVPVYVCATSATPFVAALMAKGLSPGAALIFLSAGPATNISTMLVIKNELGSRALGIYIFGIASVALFAGYLIDFFLPSETAVGLDFSSHDHGMPIWTQAAGLVLSGLLLLSLNRQHIAAKKA